MKKRCILGLGCSIVLTLRAWAGPTPQDYRAWLGVLLGDAVDGGVELLALVPDSPAERAGLRPGDILIRAATLPLSQVDDLTVVLEKRRPGDVLSLEVLRTGQRILKEVELGSRRSTPLARIVPEAPAPRAAPSMSLCRQYGLAVVDVTPDLRRHYGAPVDAGVLVTRIEPDQLAAIAGFQVGDILIQLGQEPIEQAAEVEGLLQARSEERGVRASLIRNRQPAWLTLGSPQQVRQDAVAASSTLVAPRVERASGALERAIELEIERLEQRLEELQQKLDELRRR